MISCENAVSVNWLLAVPIVPSPTPALAATATFNTVPAGTVPLVISTETLLVEDGEITEV